LSLTDPLGVIENNMKKIATSLILIFLTTSAVLAQGYCGDAFINEESGEECDDGNFVSRDGCSSYCKLEDMEPATVTSASIEEGATGIATTTSRIKVYFSEPIDNNSINPSNIQLKQGATIFDTNFTLSNDGKTLTVKINEDLYGELDHVLVVKKLKDISGNIMDEVFVRTFTTGEFIDHQAPTIVINTEGGEYSFAQSIILTAYINEETWTDELIDEGATIYYTLDGTNPTTNSSVYEGPIKIEKNTVLKYFGIDDLGNRGHIKTESYTFGCGNRSNAKRVTPYPTCQIQECESGYNLKGNICMMELGESDDYRDDAATAPLLSSNTPMTISTKPALYITSKHKGVIPRPIIFKDYLLGTILNFEKNTEIKLTDDRAFAGYIIPPTTLFSKDFPIHFGYTFKSIFKFEPAEGEDLVFNPAYRITIPFTDRYDENDPITVFTYDPEVEMYHKYDQAKVVTDYNQKIVTITSDKTDTFFIAQPGKSYNKAEFKDMVGHWAQYYAESLYRMDIVKGRSKGKYSPDDILTRAEFIKITLNAIDEDVNPFDDIEDAPFYDVPLYAWYVPYIKRAKEIGLINGYPDGTFKPDSPINRAEAIKILMTAFDFDLFSAGIRGDKFTDIYTDQWYFPALNFAYKSGLVDGIRLPGGRIMTESFGPARNMTRGEMAKMAVKSIEFKEYMANEE
jgi:cysteine-rich repeat protein